jgi:NADPH:quinone reductase-like Zn-dependent oxidoreductase
MRWIGFERGGGHAESVAVPATNLIDVVQLTTEGHLVPVVGARYSLDEAAASAERLAAGNVVGRIILTRA